MKILMLNYEFPPLGGGAANANYYLLKEFADTDIEIDLVTSSPDKYEEEEFAENIKIYKLDIGKNDIHYWKQSEILKYSWKAYWFSKGLMQEKEYDLVHAWFGIPCGFIAKRLGLPYITALRGSDVPGYNSRFSFQYVFLKPIIRSIWRNSEKVIANSNDLKDLAKKTAPYQPIEVIHNGIDLEEFKPKEIYGDGNILCVSRLIERKGIQYLIEALQEFDNELVIVGNGNLMDELKNLAKELGVNKRVKFTGEVEHEKIVEYYHDADIFVLPSLNEGMSNTILEAMACGLPIITTDTGGTRLLVKDNGFLVPMKNSNAIADAIKKYDNKLLKMHGKRSREIVEKMGWNKIAGEYFKTYQK